MNFNFNTITTLIVSVIVVVMISAAALVPIVQEAQKDQSTIIVQTTEKYSVASTSEKITITFDSGPVINDVPVTLSETARMFVISDKAVINLGATSIVATSPAINNENYSISITSSNAATASIVYDGGSLTFDDGTNQYTTTYDYLLIPDANGSYGAWLYSDRPFYVDSDKNIYLMNRVNARSYVISGTIDNLNVDFAINNNVLVNNATVSATYEPTDYNASNKVTAITFTAGEGMVVSNQDVIFAPLAYTQISEEQNMNIVILGIIPLLIFVVPIMLIVRSFYNGRD